MTFKDLCNFIENKMRMSQIYQPLLIRSLIDSDGKATIRQLATKFNDIKNPRGGVRGVIITSGISA